MKKFILVMLAAVMAIGFSAFTSAPEKETTPYFWFDESEMEFVEYEGGLACPEGQVTICTVDDIEEQGSEILYRSQSLNDPLKYN